jgi:hypothetical protein
MPTLNLEDLLERLEKMERAIVPYSKAKAERVYIENFLRSKKALLMQQSDEKTIAGKEAFAYAHDEYIQLLHGLREAVETEEKCRWSLERLKIETELYRTVQANERYVRERL